MVTNGAREARTDATLTAVYFALNKAGVKGLLAVDAITEMTNAGITFSFREHQLETEEKVYNGPALF